MGIPGGIADGVTAGAGKMVALGCGFAGAPIGGGVGGGVAAAAGVQRAAGGKNGYEQAAAGEGRPGAFYIHATSF